MSVPASDETVTPVTEGAAVRVRMCFQTDAFGRLLSLIRTQWSVSAAKLWKTCVVLLPRFASVTVADPALQSWNRLLPTPSSLYDTPINACPVPTVVSWSP